jgi:hypothetical protein
VVTLLVIFVGVNWIAPVALSFYAAKKAPTIARVVPTDLKDKSVSNAIGTKGSYFSYEFEIPWTDLDETQTKLYPKDKPEKTKVMLEFHSGLRLLFSAVPPRVWANQLSEEMKLSPQAIDSIFGPGVSKSDYSFVKAMYEFTPDKMDHWSFSRSSVNKDEMLLIIKSIALPKTAESGIFDIQNKFYKGFQQGDPAAHPDKIVVDLYSDEGGVELIFFLKDKGNHIVTQSEINRIIQSLHKATPSESIAARGNSQITSAFH